jgi:Ca-activated chloride channel family protein
MYMGNNFKSNISYLLILLLAILPVIVFGQDEKKFIRQGNGKYNDNKFAEAEVSYRKAVDKNKLSKNAGFNLGDALYKQNKYEEAGKEFLDNSSLQTDKIKKSLSFYNLGNSLLNNKKLQESIEAYKNSLILNPDNKEAKYNLAYAQDLLRIQEQQQKNQNNQQNNKDNKKDDQKKEQNKNQKKDQDKKQDQKQSDQQKQDQQQQQEQKISKEDAQRLLNALANDEKNVQEKVKLAKAAKERVKTRINW